MSVKSVKVIAQRGKQRMEFESIKEAAHSFDCYPNSIRFSHDMKKPHKGWYFTIEKADSKKCNSCETVLTTPKDDYCTKCYYEELTGKPMFESEKMGLLQTPTIMYQANGE
jgi:hypothetical protein